MLLVLLMILCVSRRAKPEGPGQLKNAAYYNGVSIKERVRDDLEMYRNLIDE